MKIVHASTYDTAGGAARATFRLHTALVRSGQDSVLVCKIKDSVRADVFEARSLMPAPPDSEGTGAEALRLQRRMNALLGASRTPLTDTIFTATAAGHDISGLAPIQDCDVIQLHWISQFLSPADIGRLGELGKPLAWRLSDLWPFTGGCHYAAGCQGFLRDCAACPQLVPALHALPVAQLAAKRRSVAQSRLTVVSPSRWLAGLARESSVFKGKRVEVIVNGVDQERFQPVTGARRRLGLPQDAACVLFVATHTERRKGFHLLVQALEELHRSFGGPRLPDGRQLIFCCLGQGVERLSGLGVEVYPYGFVNDDVMLRLIYSAADVFVIPSTEENLPSSALEAMACSLPVVGFQAGGVPDLVEQGRTGLMVPVGDVTAMAGAIRELLLNPRAARDMGRAGRERVERELSVDTQAARYLDLYRDLARDIGARPSAFAPRTEATKAAEAQEIPPEVLALVRKAEDLPDRQGHLERAFALRDAGQAAQGRQVLEELARRLPEDVEVRQCLGGMLAAEGRAHEAVDCFRWCLTRRPGHHEYRLNMSDAWRYAGLAEEALAALLALEAASPRHRGLWLKRGQALAAAGRIREALHALAREVRGHGCPRAAALLRELFPRRNARARGEQ